MPKTDIGNIADHLHVPIPIDHIKISPALIETKGGETLVWGLRLWRAEQSGAEQRETSELIWALYIPVMVDFFAVEVEIQNHEWYSTKVNSYLTDFMRVAWNAVITTCMGS